MTENIREKKIKIGILTFHDGHNFGGFLQSYALQKTLERLGFKAEFINYRSYYHTYKEYRCLFGTRRPKVFFAGFLKMMAFYRAHKKFNLSRAISNAKGLSSLNYSGVIFGSDEVWNYSSPIIKLDPVYYGIGVPTKLRISYAASCGSLPSDSVVPDLVSQAWRNFDHISVRDENSKAIVSKHVKKDVELVLDPTFLVDFSGEEITCPQSDFILVYTTEFSADVQKSVREYATRVGKRLVSVGYRNAFCDVNIIGIGPFEFLGYVKAASVVITSMFHGTIFAVKYNKPFAIVVDPYRTNKLATMLEQLELVDRLTDAEGLEATLCKPIDYERVNGLIEEGVEHSMNFLQRVCKDVK